MIISASLTEYNIYDIKKSLDTKIIELPNDGLYDYLVYPTYTMQSPSTSGPFWFGDKMVIKWNYTEQLSDLIPSTSIAICENEDTSNDIFTNIKTSVKNVMWLIPSQSNLKLDSKYYIKVYTDIDGYKIEDNSQEFTFDKRSFTIIKDIPNIPIKANIGNTVDINWIENGAGDYFKIELLRAYGEDGQISTVIDDKYYTTGNTYTWKIENLEPDLNINDNINIQECRIKITDIEHNLSDITQKINLLIPYVSYQGTIGRLIKSAENVDDIIIGTGEGDATLALYGFNPSDFRVPYTGSFTFNYDTTNAVEVYLTKLSKPSYYEALPRLSGIYSIEDAKENETYTVNARDDNYFVKNAQFSITIIMPKDDTGDGGDDGGGDDTPKNISDMTKLEFLKYCVSLGEESLTSGDAIISPPSEIPTLVMQYKKESDEMIEGTPCTTILYLLTKVITFVIEPLWRAEDPTVPFIFLGPSSLRNRIKAANNEWLKRGRGAMCDSKITLSVKSLTFQGISINADSEIQTYNVQGKGLLSDIDISAPEGFKIARSRDSNFGKTLLIPASDAEGKKVFIDVIFNSDKTIYDGVIVHKTQDSPDAVLNVAGTLPEQSIFTDKSEISFGDVSINTPAYNVYTVWAIGITGNLHIYAPIDYKVSVLNGQPGRQLTLYSDSTGKILPTEIKVQFTPSGIGHSINKIEHHIAEGYTVSQLDVKVDGYGIGNPDDNVITLNPKSITFSEEISVGRNIKTQYYVKSNWVKDNLKISVSDLSPFIISKLYPEPKELGVKNLTINRNEFGAISDTTIELKFVPTTPGRFFENVSHIIGNDISTNVDLPASGYTAGYGTIVAYPSLIDVGKMNIEGNGIVTFYDIWSSVAIDGDVTIQASDNCFIALHASKNYVKTLFIQRDIYKKIDGKKIDVLFKPMAIGKYSEVIHHLIGNDANSAADVIITGEVVTGGENNTAALIPSLLDFGGVKVNTSSVLSYKVMFSNDVINATISTSTIQIPPYLSTPYTISESPIGPFVSSFTVENTGIERAIYVKFEPVFPLDYNTETIMHIISLTGGIFNLELKGRGII